MAKEIIKEQPKQALPERPADDLAIEWDAPKFIYYPKDGRWYGVVLVSAAILIALIWFLRGILEISPWLAMAVIAAGAAGLLSRATVKPPQVHYAVTEVGVEIDGKLHAYTEFRAFSVVDMDNHFMLRLWPHPRYYLPVTILIEQVSPQDIREVLAEALPEGEHSATLGDWIAHLTKF